MGGRPVTPILMSLDLESSTAEVRDLQCGVEGKALERERELRHAARLPRCRVADDDGRIAGGPNSRVEGSSTTSLVNVRARVFQRPKWPLIRSPTRPKTLG